MWQRSSTFYVERPNQTSIHFCLSMWLHGKAFNTWLLYIFIWIDRRDWSEPSAVAGLAFRAANLIIITRHTMLQFKRFKIQVKLLPMSLRGSRTSHFGSDRKNMETCCRAISGDTDRQSGDYCLVVALILNYDLCAAEKKQKNKSAMTWN